MNRKVGISLIVSLAVLVVLLAISRQRPHDPRDLIYWIRAGANQDWTAAAAQGNPEAEFYRGSALISTNLQMMVDRVPRLSAIPIIGKRFFETRSYGIDSQIDPEQLNEAYHWIAKSANHGFAPAKEAEKLFRGRIVQPAARTASTNRQER